jgi:hypothetical protein
VRFAEATAREVPPDWAESYRIAAQSLLGFTWSVSRTGRASAKDLGRLAAFKIWCARTSRCSVPPRVERLQA